VSTQKSEHVGTKTVAVFFGMLLAFVYTILRFFTTPVLTVTDLYNIGLNTAFYLIVWTLIIFAGQLLWVYTKRVQNKIKAADVEDLGTTDLAMYFGIILSVIYTILQFFVNPVADVIVLYNIALVTAFFAVVWVLIVLGGILIWTYAHGLSDKIGQQTTK